jgi:hypothetical protein
MYTARIVVLTTAPAAGGIAAYLARRFDAKSLQAEPSKPRSAMRGLEHVRLRHPTLDDHSEVTKGCLL